MKTEAEMARMQPEAWGCHICRQYQELKRQQGLLPWSLWREHNPAHT